MALFLRSLLEDDRRVTVERAMMQLQVCVSFEVHSQYTAHPTCVTNTQWGQHSLGFVDWRNINTANPDCPCSLSRGCASCV